MFAKFVGTPFLQNTTGRLLLIMAVSIVMQGELENETVNDTKTKAYLLIAPRSVSYQKRAVLVKFEQVSEAVVRRCSSKQVFLKISQIPQGNTCAGDTFQLSCNSEGTIKKRLQHRCFPAKFAKFLRTLFFTEQLQWLLLTFNSYFQRSPQRKPVRLSAINTRFN